VVREGISARGICELNCGAVVEVGTLISTASFSIMISEVMKVSTHLSRSSSCSRITCSLRQRRTRQTRHRGREGGVERMERGKGGGRKGR